MKYAVGDKVIVRKTKKEAIVHQARGPRGGFDAESAYQLNLGETGGPPELSNWYWEHELALQEQG